NSARPTPVFSINGYDRMPSSCTASRMADGCLRSLYARRHGARIDGAQLIAAMASLRGECAGTAAGAERIAQEDLGDGAIDVRRAFLRRLARHPPDRGAGPDQAVLRRIDQVD